MKERDDCTLLISMSWASNASRSSKQIPFTEWQFCSFANASWVFCLLIGICEERLRLEWSMTWGSDKCKKKESAEDGPQSDRPWLAVLFVPIKFEGFSIDFCLHSWDCTNIFEHLSVISSHSWLHASRMTAHLQVSIYVPLEPRKKLVETYKDRFMYLCAWMCRPKCTKYKRLLGQKFLQYQKASSLSENHSNFV